MTRRGWWEGSAETDKERCPRVLGTWPGVSFPQARRVSLAGARLREEAGARRGHGGRSLRAALFCGSGHGRYGVSGDMALLAPKTALGAWGPQEAGEARRATARPWGLRRRALARAVALPRGSGGTGGGGGLGVCRAVLMTHRGLARQREHESRGCSLCAGGGLSGSRVLAGSGTGS